MRWEGCSGAGLALPDDRFVPWPRPGSPFCLWIWPHIGNTHLSELSSLWCMKPPLCHLVIIVAYVWTFYSENGIRPLSVMVLLSPVYRLYIYIYIYIYIYLYIYIYINMYIYIHQTRGVSVSGGWV